MAHAMQFCMECLSFCCAVNLLHFCVENVIKYSSRLHCDLHFALNAFRTVSQRVSNSDDFLDDEAMKNHSGMPKLPVWNSVQNLFALEFVFTSLADAFVPFAASKLVSSFTAQRAKPQLNCRWADMYGVVLGMLNYLLWCKLEKQCSLE